jgi:fibronectin type 3 domain-containing protein
MPTISQLPHAEGVTAADILPLSQEGVTRAVSVGALLATTQPAIIAQSSNLLGRVSVGPGGPEEVSVGNGLELLGTTLSATGSDHASFPQQPSFSSAAMLVISNAGQPGLLPITALRSLFSGSTGVSISSLGVISVTDPSQSGPDGSNYAISGLPVVSALSGQDLVAASRAGTDCAITFADLLDGQTIDMAQAADLASDTDTFWVAQGGNTMSRQTLGAVWAWMSSKLPAYKIPIIEISTNTTLDGTVHNARVLLCIGAVTLSAAPINMGSGFYCDVINMSLANVVLAGGIITSSGQLTLPAGQSMRIYAATYSGGTLVYGWMSASLSSAAAPEQVGNLAVNSHTSGSVSLTWSAPASGGAVASYSVNYRVSGTSSWAPAGVGIGLTQYEVISLAANTTYDFVVYAVNGAASGAASNIVTVSTSAATAPPSSPGNFAIVSVTANSISLTWSAPSTGIVQNYAVQYRITGSSSWAGNVTGVMTTNYTVTGLTSGLSYDLRVAAVGFDGSSTASNIIVGGTLMTAGSVSSITWNVVPVGTFSHGIGSIGVNAHVTPATAAVQFGLSTSTSTPPTTWTGGVSVNTDLWGAYIPTPALPGTWYAWAEGIDGSAPTVYPTGITVT